MYLFLYDNFINVPNEITLCMLGKNFSRRHFKEKKSYFSKNIGFDTSCKLSPEVRICMKCQILFSRKNKKNIILLSAEFAQRVEIMNTCP